jgi:hypothetical protein
MVRGRGRSLEANVLPAAAPEERIFMLHFTPERIRRTDRIEVALGYDTTFTAASI